MPYTLMMGLAWVLLAALVGIVVGWLLRSVVSGRQLARARKRHAADVAALETELAAAREAGVATPSVAPGAGAPHGDGSLGSTAAGPADPARPGVHVVTDDDRDDATRSLAALATAEPMPVELDLDQAGRVLGRPVALDDLTVIEGIGPKIAELCRGIGISTWSDLAGTEVSLLRTMLADAGSRYRVHDPTTWPHQARLLADGRWDEFARLTAESSRGRRSG